MAKNQTERRPKNLPQNLVVIELSEGKRRVPDRPHLYVLRTQRTPEAVLKTVQEGNGPKWITGTAKTLRNDLVPKYKPTRKLKVAEERVKRLKTDLARQGFAINGDSKTWRVYVLNIDADVAPPIPMKNRGKLGKVVYVGQTSLTLSAREARHRGAPSKAGRYIGGRKSKGRILGRNVELTPTKHLFTEDDAKKFESLTAKRLKRVGYRVLGDGLTDPAKRSRKKESEKGLA
jgi:hypothetical protein